MGTPIFPAVVTIQPNSSGQAIDVVLVDYNTLSPTNVLVGREVVALGDPNNAFNVVTVSAFGEAATKSPSELNAQLAIIAQLRITNYLLYKSLTDPISLKRDDLAALEAQFLALPPPSTT